MKKLIYIANIRIPTEKAHGVQIMKMCEAFSMQGIGVELIVPWRFNHIKKDPFSYYGMEENFKIKKVFSVDLIRFGKIGFRIQSFSFAVSSFIYSIFRKVGIIYSRDELPLYFLGFIKKNIVYESHTPRFNFIIKKFNKIITISNGLKEFYLEKGISENKIITAHDAVSLEDFDVVVNKADVRQRLGIPLDKPVVMYLGRLDPWKGVDTFLEASNLISEVSVVVAGEGSQLNVFKKKYPNVIFLGNTPYRDLPQNQQAADILVIPNSSKSDVSRLYTSPLKVFAHMASGVPIVASGLPSIREVLNESNSILVIPDDVKALSDTIKDVLANRSDAFSRASQAKEDVKQYTWDDRAKSIIEFVK